VSATDPTNLRRLSREMLEKAKVEPDTNLKGHLIRAALTLAQLAEKLARGGSKYAPNLGSTANLCLGLGRAISGTMPKLQRLQRRTPQQMKLWLAAVVFILLVTGDIFADSPPLTPDSFGTSAEFAVDNNHLSLSSVIATIEPRVGAPGYSWVRIHFYSFPPASADMTAIENGDVASMDKKWEKLADRHDNSYNISNAVVQLSVDKDYKVWQVDMAVPGHTCTIAPFEKDVKSFLQNYRFDGKNLRLKSKGSYVCDMKFMKLPDQTFSWDIDLTIPVYEKGRWRNR
jgi:hypothetical protein